MKYQLGKKKFKTKKEVESYLSYILNNTKLGTPLKRYWKDIVIDLLTYHPSYKKKVGVGVKEITTGIAVDSYTGYSTTHFVVRRFDDSSVDFSFLKCIRFLSPIGENIKRLHKTEKLLDLKKAMRYEIKEQIYEFKKNYFDGCKTKKCQGTGKRMRWKGSEVDHIYPLTFDKLAYDFMDENGFKLSSIRLKELPGHNKCFKNRKKAALWKQYHSDHCLLRVVTSKFNQTQKKAEGVPWDLL